MSNLGLTATAFTSCVALGSSISLSLFLLLKTGTLATPLIVRMTCYDTEHRVWHAYFMVGISIVALHYRNVVSTGTIKNILLLI